MSDAPVNLTHGPPETVLDAEPADARQGLRALQRAELVREGARWPEPVFRFRHSLIQEAAYRSLLRRRRQAGQRQLDRPGLAHDEGSRKDAARLQSARVRLGDRRGAGRAGVRGDRGEQDSQGER